MYKPRKLKCLNIDVQCICLYKHVLSQVQCLIPHVVFTSYSHPQLTTLSEYLPTTNHNQFKYPYSLLSFHWFSVHEPIHFEMSFCTYKQMGNHLPTCQRFLVMPPAQFSGETFGQYSVIASTIWNSPPPNAAALLPSPSLAL